MITVALFAIAAALAVGNPADRQLQRLGPAPTTSSGPRWGIPAMLVFCVLGIIWLVLGSRVLGWALAAGVLVATAGWLTHRTRVERQRSRARADTARAARTLALLLQAGQTPTRALEDAAADCPALSAVARTRALGGDVVSAFHELGGAPGCAGYRRVGAAWYVSERSGAPIAPVLAQVAENLRHERHLSAIVAAELASARASGRIMGVLPFVAIAMGAVAGASPLEFLFGSSLGQAAFLAGTVLVASGVVWTERIARTGESVEART